MPLRILIDGACPICRREAEFLRWADRGRGRLIVEDINSPFFDPGRYGLSLEEVMGQIHAITWDGRVLRGLEVFRRAYAAIGLGWLVAPTGWPMVRPLANIAYRFFARHRLRFTGRGGCHMHQCR